jgi:uncharacterized membrane protein
MKLFKKAMVRGVTAIVIVYLLTLIPQATTGIWEPLMEIMGIRNATLEWILSIGLTIVAIALIGYAIVLMHPFKRIASKILVTKAREAKSVVFVKWGGNWFYGWLTGSVEVDGQILYRVTVPSAPVPMTGHIMLVPLENIKFTDVSMAEHLTQLASMGFNALRGLIGTRSAPPEEDALAHGIIDSTEFSKTCCKMNRLEVGWS